MPRYVYEDENGERFEFESDEELDVEDDEESDDEEGDVEGDEPDEEESPQDDAAQYARVEAFYRSERAALRGVTDPGELRLKRQEYERALRTPNASRIGTVRVRDLLELVEQRELDLRAQRLAGQKR